MQSGQSRSFNLATLLSALLALVAAPPLAAQEKADYSSVVSREAAEEMVREGKLFRILLFPAEFGGEEIAHNIAYVPAGIPEAKDALTGTLIRYFEEGLIDKLSVQPDYRGASLVPTRIRFHASHGDKPGAFDPVIEIW